MKQFGLLILTLVVILGYNANAKVLPPPTLEGALNSPCIVIATYQGYTRNGDKKDYYVKTIANYNIENILKGDFPYRSIDVNYSFDNHSMCIAPEDWQFNENLMPKSGSKWILFLEGSPDNLRTHRGDFGRMGQQNRISKK